jgi:hypothetical protein
MDRLSDVEVRWRLGESVAGVAFGPKEHVRILEGAFADECACVEELLSVAPEPCYRVVVDCAHIRLELTESSLSSA